MVTVGFLWILFLCSGYVNTLVLRLPDLSGKGSYLLEEFSAQ